MIKSYINKIKANISIYTTKKTSNLLDGSYRSIFKGKSMNFDDLREYIPGDNIKDIDWKASARNRFLLVKQYVAEKKHNVLLVIDTNRKMMGVAPENETKKEIALMTAGTIGYIAIKNNDVVSVCYSDNTKPKYFPFKSRTDNLEIFLAQCDHDINDKNKSDINNTLEYIRTHIQNRMLIVIITDLDGVENINTKYLNELTLRNEVLLVSIEDANIYGDKAYSIDSNSYIYSLFSKSKMLREEEKKIKEDIYKNSIRKFKKYRIMVSRISSVKEIPNKIIKLLEECRYASKG